MTASVLLLPKFQRVLRRAAAHGAMALLLFASQAARAQQPWRNATSPTAQTLWGIVYGEDRFVAVGEAGTIVTSPDGLAWTRQNSGTSAWLLAVAWSPTLKTFIAVGDAGTILISPDGITWTARASGTRQRLNSVAWNSKRFSFPDVILAVGENGTALTSSDLATWSLRTSGDAGWLRGITAGQGSDTFVVTGHDGTILKTTDAGGTFTRQPSGTALHLDAIAWLDNRLYATGTDFVLSRSDDWGSTWSLDRSINADGRENGFTYNGLIGFNHTLVAVGDAGRIRDEFGRDWATTEPLVANWRAVAASATRVVAVGTGGAIASAPIDPEVLHEIAITTATVGERIVLHAALVRSAVGGAGIQWSREGQLIAGANGTSLSLAPDVAALGGTYTATATFVQWSEATGSTTSTSQATITLPARAASAGTDVVDPNFRPALNGAPRLVVPLADGRVLVAGETTSQVLRLNADGSRDSSFQIPAGALPAGRPDALLPEADGAVVVLLRKENSAPPQYVLVRLRSDGSIDASFTPDPLLSASGAPPIRLADGRWLAVADPTRTAATLRRFLADGTLDPAYAPRDLGIALSAGPGITGLFEGPLVLGARDPLNRVYLGVRYGDIYGPAAVSGKTRLWRLTPTGEIDPGFAAVDVEPLQQLFAVPQGLLAQSLTVTWRRMDATYRTSSIYRLRFDGSVDPHFKPVTAAWSVGSPVFADDGVPDGYEVMAATDDGGFVARAAGRRGHFGLVRFRSDGEFDADFSAELDANTAAISSVNVLPNGAVLVGGTFGALGSIAQPWLAKVQPDPHAATTHFSNVSVRARAGSGAATLIAGYVARGGDTSVLARAAGPALSGFNVSGVLADPQLGLFSGSAQISGNDDWGNGPAAFLAATAARVGAFPFVDRSADAALYTTAPAGAYSVQVNGKSGATGVALAELYAAGPVPLDATSPRVTNFSVRAQSGTASEALVVGFTIAGERPRNVVVRAIGPALEAFGVTATLPDPVLTVYRGTTAIATNDDWAIDVDTRNVLAEAFATVGAFSLPYNRTYPYAGSKDAALLLTLAPGSYTMQIGGKAGATGVVLAEIYEVP